MFGASGLNDLLLRAAKIGDYNSCRLALEQCAECVNTKDRMDGNTVLINALSYDWKMDELDNERRCIPIVDLLLIKGAEVNVGNKKGRTALMQATKHGYAKIIPYLLLCGANVNAKDKYGVTALMEAAKGGYIEIVQLLLERGADVNAQNKNNKIALLHYILKNKVKNPEEDKYQYLDPSRQLAAVEKYKTKKIIDLS